MRRFKTKWVARFARREGISDESLREAIDRAEQGVVDADLGGGLIKQRVARQGQGRSGGFRTIIAYQAKRRAVFLYGFAKSERDNIGSGELLSLREIGQGWLAASAAKIIEALEDGALQEINDDQEK
ncbi:MAG TPA: type II toxin-antitoxin system RelE/ParE family toxin [Terracidiphilus sp.]